MGDHGDRSSAEERTGYRSGDPDFTLPGADAKGAGPTRAGPAGKGEVEAGTALFCDLCGGRMLDRHCKLLCLACGYQRDCSDP